MRSRILTHLKKQWSSYAGVAVIAGALLLSANRAGQIGSDASAVTTAESAIPAMPDSTPGAPDTYWIMAIHNGEPQCVKIDLEWVVVPTEEATDAPNALTATPTAIVQPSATVTRTPSPNPTTTNTPTRTPSATPTVVTGTPAPVATIIPTISCYLLDQGAVRAEPKGMVWYRLTQSGLTYQNVRNAPVGGNIVGKVLPGVEYAVYWRITAAGNEWLALDEQCDRWVAGYLGNVSIHP